MTVKVRFAPSPTGFLHVGNIRVAIINFLYAKKNKGQFFLRLDDTDSQRVRDEYRDMIFKDMEWLGLAYDGMFKQSDRLLKYDEAKKTLINSKRLYECYETNEELSLQRKSQIASGVAPIYNRNSLKLTSEQKNNLRKQGLKPHYRFLLEEKTVSWEDKIKGKISYDGRHFSDPILIREEDEKGYGIPTYTFCSVVDDIDFGITDIIRGEDHITNTAIQIQIFEALGSKVPDFSHLSLVKASEGKISKREGGFDVKTLRQDGYEPMSIINLLAQIGTSESTKVFTKFDELVEEFSLSKFSKSATNYDISELANINQKLLQCFDFEDIRKELKIDISDEYAKKIWQATKRNLKFLSEFEEWRKIFRQGFYFKNKTEDFEFLSKCLEVLPEKTDEENSWNLWLESIKTKSDRKGKDLFTPIRMALTGKENGPELKQIMELISKEEIVRRLKQF